MLACFHSFYYNLRLSCEVVSILIKSPKSLIGGPDDGLVVDGIDDVLYEQTILNDSVPDIDELFAGGHVCDRHTLASHATSELRVVLKCEPTRPPCQVGCVVVVPIPI